MFFIKYSKVSERCHINVKLEESFADGYPVTLINHQQNWIKINDLNGVDRTFKNKNKITRFICFSSMIC